MAATSGTNFGSEKGTSNYMILVPLFDLKFLNELAAGGAGTSNRRHWRGFDYTVRPAPASKCPESGLPPAEPRMRDPVAGLDAELARGARHHFEDATRQSARRD